MPSETKTTPTIRRTKMTEEGAFVASDCLIKSILSFSMLGAHGPLGTVFIIIESLSQAKQNFGACFKHGLRFGFVEFFRVLTQVIDQLVKFLLNVLSAISWVAFLEVLIFHLATSLTDSRAWKCL